MTKLPIYDIKGQLVESIASTNRVIISAPTGSGKSTMVPQFLLDNCRIKGRILVLQPRRIAARMLSTLVAKQRKTKIGTDIGYQTRFDSRFTANTRILYVTEGILPRLLLSNPPLTGIGAVVFDEFHERSVTVDLGLGLIKRLQEASRSDLLAVVMSATLDLDILQTYLERSHTLTSQGRQFPVTIEYTPPVARVPVWEQAARALRKILKMETSGDILIFMPGVHEIRKTISECRKSAGTGGITYLPLYGDLSADQQDAVMKIVPGRKVIVATNIAETSLTIPNIRYVIDSGQARVNRFDHGRGLNTLNIESIARDSADQRAGRAGRIAPGTCIRLWSSSEHRRRSERTDPEIHRIDLSETILQLMSLGFRAVDDFPWLDRPARERIADAVSLLIRLGALEKADDQLTRLGRQLALIPAHPRLSKLLVSGGERCCTHVISLIAAILNERTIRVNDKTSRKAFNGFFDNTLSELADGDTEPVYADIFAVVNAVRWAQRNDFKPKICQGRGINAAASRNVWRTYDYFFELSKRTGFGSIADDCGGVDVMLCLLEAYPDHLAKRRDSGSLVCRLGDGRCGEIERDSTVRDSELILPLDVREIDQAGRAPKVLLSMTCEIEVEWLIDAFPEDWTFTKETRWNDQANVVDTVHSDTCLGLVIHDRRSSDVDPDEAAKILATVIRENKLTLKNWNKEVKEWMQRTRCVAEWFPEKNLIQYSDDDIAEIHHDLCSGERRLEDVNKKPCLPYVKNRLSYDDQRFVETMAPATLLLPGGRKLRIRYRPGQAPKGNAKIQDLYGLTSSPVIANGRQKVLMEILAPNMRPVQVTDDLAGFWEKLYPRVKKELSKKYPKHEWR